jgi:SAM-dependent methyltransferase
MQSMKIQIRDAFEEVRSRFPFEGYMNESKYCAISVIVHALCESIPTFAGKRLLDIGCGPMDKTAVLKKLGFDCCAADDLTDPWHLQDGNQVKIKRFAEAMGIAFHHQNEGEYSLPFEVNSFDVVSSFAVIEHLHESPRQLLNAMGRYARPGGWLVVTTPNSVNLRKRISVLFGRTNYPPVGQFLNARGLWRGHVREYTLSELTHVCKDSGFEIVANRTFEHIAYERLSMPLRQVYLLLGTLLPTLRSGLLVVCRKPEGWSPVEANRQERRSSMTRRVSEEVAGTL